MSRRVVVVRLDNAGDVLLSGPAVRAVAASGAEVHLLCGPRGADAARLLPAVTAVHVARVPWIDPDPEPVDSGRVLALVDRLAPLRFDEAIICTSFHQDPLPTALVLRMAGVRRIAAVSRDYPGSLLDVRHVVDDDVHEVERALSLAAAAGHRLAPGDDGRLAVRGRTGGRPRSHLVVHPGASVPARAFDTATAATTVARLAGAGWTVVVTGDETARALTARVAGDAGIDLGGRTDLAGLARVVGGARAIVVGNTGPAHLAAAVGTPVVSIFAPTVPAVRWRPWMVPHVLLGDQTIACAGCRALDCPVPGHPCVGRLGPDDVLRALATLGVGHPPVRTGDAAVRELAETAP